MRGGQSRFGYVAWLLQQFSRELSNGTSEFQWTTGGIATPKWHPARLARGRGNQHAVVGNVQHAPRRSPQQEHLTGPRLVHHFLIQLADPLATATGVLGEKDTVQA